MEFSVVASFTGVMPEHDAAYYPCDTTLQDAIRACNEAGLEVDAESDLSEIGESEYSYLAEESEQPNWFDNLQDVQVAGILTRDQLTALLDGTGAYADTCETMGTLGGPLAPWGGIVADIDCQTESQVLISCIRVTPIPMRHGEPMRGDERTWDRLRVAFLSIYGC